MADSFVADTAGSFAADKPKSALSRFGDALIDQGPVAALQGVKHLIEHPIDTITRDLPKAHQKVMATAAERFKKGDYGDALATATLGMIPGVGPQMLQIIEAADKNADGRIDADEAPELLGGLTGAGGTALLAPKVPGAAKAAGRAVAGAGRAVVNAARVPGTGRVLTGAAEAAGGAGLAASGLARGDVASMVLGGERVASGIGRARGGLRERAAAQSQPIEPAGPAASFHEAAPPVEMMPMTGAEALRGRNVIEMPRGPQAITPEMLAKIEAANPGMAESLRQSGGPLPTDLAPTLESLPPRARAAAVALQQALEGGQTAIEPGLAPTARSTGALPAGSGQQTLGLKPESFASAARDVKVTAIADVLTGQGIAPEMMLKMTSAERQMVAEAATAAKVEALMQSQGLTREAATSAVVPIKAPSLKTMAEVVREVKRREKMLK